jgi:hypothetical protein
MAVEYVIRNGRRIEVETLETSVAPKRRRHSNPHIGCPLEWLRGVLPLVATKEQLVVAIWLHRRYAVCGGEPFTVPNKALSEDLGIDRWVKYRTLQRLEAVEIIALIREGKRTLRVKIRDRVNCREPT